MQINKLISGYVTERDYPPENMDALLDFYQSKYIAQQIDILEYKSIFGYLSGRGAVSAHDYAQLMK